MIMIAVRTRMGRGSATGAICVGILSLSACTRREARTLPQEETIQITLLPQTADEFAEEPIPPPPSVEPSQPSIEEARPHYERPPFWLDDNPEAQLVESERAVQLRPSYKLLYNIARANIMLHRLPAAHRAFRMYLAWGGDKIPAKRRRDVDEELARIEAKTGWLAIGCAIGADLRWDGVPIGTCPLRRRFRVMPGSHKLEAQHGRAIAMREVVLDPKELVAFAVSR
jgi:hypothetical protein